MAKKFQHDEQIKVEEMRLSLKQLKMHTKVPAQQNLVITEELDEESKNRIS